MTRQWVRDAKAGMNVAVGFQPTADLAGPGTVERTVARVAAPTLSIWDRLDRWFWRQEQRRLEAYLGTSTDLVELEQRMRALEHTSFGVSRP
jgi:hypothetical protein